MHKDHVCVCFQANMQLVTRCTLGQYKRVATHSKLTWPVSGKCEELHCKGFSKNADLPWRLTKLWWLTGKTELLVLVLRKMLEWMVGLDFRPTTSRRSDKFILAVTSLLLSPVCTIDNTKVNEANDCKSNNVSKHIANYWCVGCIYTDFVTCLPIKFLSLHMHLKCEFYTTLVPCCSIYNQ